MGAVNIPVCHVCGDKRSTHFLKKGKFDYYRCRNCDGIFVWPLRSQDFYGNDTYLKDPTIYAQGINLQGQRWMIEQFERLYRDIMQTPHKGSFFEVGAGAGYFTLFGIARDWEAAGIETSADSAKFARDYLRVPVEEAFIESYDSIKKYDAIVMVEVLEHFLDPVKAIDALRPLAKEKTLIFGTTPNTDSDHWRTGDQDIYVPEDHIYLFNDYSIRRFAERAGIKDFTVELFGSGDKHDSNLMYAGVITG